MGSDRSLRLIGMGTHVVALAADEDCAARPCSPRGRAYHVRQVTISAVNSRRKLRRS